MKYNVDLHLDERDSLSLIGKQIEEGTIILEFGPANGRFTKYLTEHKKCKVYAVEIDPLAAQDAAKYAEDVFVADIEELEWINRWENIEFDYIIFADVLEHLRNPQQVLKQTKRLLKDEGKVILSVPNVAHNSILINLYRNIFNYTPVGLLDDTHIHLFSYYSLKDMCKNAGYFPVVEDAVYMDVEDTEIHNKYSDVSREVENILRQKKYGNVYQFIFSLQKAEWVKNFELKADYRIRRASLGFRFQVFFDRGEGWIEENSATCSINNIKEFEFDIPIENGQEIKGLRIDPSNRNTLIKDFKLCLFYSNSEQIVNIQECVCNGLVNKYGTEILFETDDPQIVINNMPENYGNLERIRITCNFLDINMSEENLNKNKYFINEMIRLNSKLQLCKEDSDINKF